MTADLTVLDASNDADIAVWRRLWETSPMQSPFAHPGVCRLLGPREAELRAAVWSGADGHVLYPFFLRGIDGDRTDGGARTDIVSPYGYGGPFHWGIDDVEKVASRFWKEFDRWAETHSVVSEFIRCSLLPGRLLPYPGRLRRRQSNFVRQLNTSADHLWAGVSSKVRGNVRRAVREGVSIVVDTEGKLVDEFLGIYLATMDRRSAASWYRFDADFFTRLHTALPGRCVYIFAEHEGRPVSVDLLLLGADAGYYFLGGTDASAFSVRPNDFVKWQAMSWLNEHGFDHYVLGGGVSSGDGLERYKRGFAPAGEVAFVTGERVFAEDDYARLTAARRNDARRSGSSWDDGFFPAYRQDLASTVGADDETARV